MNTSIVSKDQFNKYLMENVDIVKKIVETGIKELLPKIIIYTIDQKTFQPQTVVLALADFGKTEKHKQIRMVGKMFATQMPTLLPVAIFFTCETWTKQMKINDLPLQGNVSDEPIKEEAIMVSGLSISHMCNMWMCPIGRGSGNNKNIMLLEHRAIVDLVKDDTKKTEHRPFIMEQFYYGWADK